MIRLKFWEAMTAQKAPTMTVLGANITYEQMNTLKSSQTKCLVFVKVREMGVWDLAVC